MHPRLQVQAVVIVTAPPRHTRSNADTTDHLVYRQPSGGFQLFLSATSSAFVTCMQRMHMHAYARQVAAALCLACAACSPYSWSGPSNAARLNRPARCSCAPCSCGDKDDDDNNADADPHRAPLAASATGARWRSMAAAVKLSAAAQVLRPDLAKSGLEDEGDVGRPGEGL